MLKQLALVDPYIVYHHPCLDGFLSAVIAWRTFGANADYVPVPAGGPFPAFEAGRPIFFLDVCPSAERLLALRRTNPITVLDHHQSSEKDVQALLHSEAGGRYEVDVNHDSNYSGAMLTWLHFEDTAPPPLVWAVMDRDLWQFKRPDTRAVNEALQSYEMDFDVWHDLLTEPMLWPALISKGEALMATQALRVQALVQEPRTAVFFRNDGQGPVEFPAVNCPYFFASDVGQALLKAFPDAPFAGSYRDLANGTRQWSLRSEEGRLDVCRIAEMARGGGHRNTAGFTEHHPMEMTAFNPKAYGA